MEGITAVFTNNVSAIVMAGIFIFYLVSRDKQNDNMMSKFNDTLTKYLEQSNQFIDNNTRATIKNDETLRDLTSMIKALSVKLKLK